jgi:hypothetical protein
MLSESHEFLTFLIKTFEILTVTRQWQIPSEIAINVVMVSTGLSESKQNMGLANNDGMRHN